MAYPRPVVRVWCEICGIKPATEVHHIRSQSSYSPDDLRQHDEDNLADLCRDCHNDIRNIIAEEGVAFEWSDQVLRRGCKNVLWYSVIVVMRNHFKLDSIALTQFVANVTTEGRRRYVESVCNDDAEVDATSTLPHSIDKYIESVECSEEEASRHGEFRKDLLKRQGVNN